MRVEFLPSSTGNAGPDHQFLTTFVLDGRIAVDAGAIGLQPRVEDQARIDHVLVSHTHMDHIATLPGFLENVYPLRESPVVVHGSQAVLDVLQDDLFNDRIWPDFIRLSEGRKPFLELSLLEDEVSVELAGLRVTPVSVDHVVPTQGFVVEDGESTVVFAGDTAPTRRIWELANQHENLKAVFLEASFPDEQSPLAEVSKHLTPRTFAEEMQKVRNGTRFFAVHVKAAFRREIEGELRGLSLPQVELGEPGRCYEF